MVPLFQIECLQRLELALPQPIFGFQPTAAGTILLMNGKRRCNHTYYCECGVAMILFPITNKEQTHENTPHTRRMAFTF